MDRYICIHSHFYQPPRENPWLEEVEQQDSAHPYHDWNARIVAECYAPNAASRILDDERRIVDIINNYSRISFNFGPTLLSWLERHDPEVYAAVIQAHHESKKRFHGNGSAIAQVYNHVIMPLANSRDKKTQVRWGVRDFEYRFGEKPKGIWLAETAVDLETLECCVDEGIAFTILAPRQAKRIRARGNGKWEEVDNGGIDPRRAYRCPLPSGRSIDLFFYDGPIAQEIAFGGLLENGQRFADRLAAAFGDGKEGARLVHVATDGETYGHHHRYGEMALAYCLYRIEESDLARLTVYGDFLDRFPPEHEVEIHENSSWSCVHGVERWRADCGCNSGGHPGWRQEWRAALRGAMDWLRDSLALVYRDKAGELFDDPWAAREGYIDVVLDRSEESLRRFFERHAARPLFADERVSALKLLEMQRHAMLMYTSCGWFFDEISGIETVQVVQYAARAMQLAREAAGIDFEPAYQKLLERAPSNLPEFATGAAVYERYVKPGVVDLLRVGAHFAASSLFSDSREPAGDIYSYRVRSETFERLTLGRQKLVLGRATLRSAVTLEETPVTFAVLHLGDQNLLGGVSREMAAGEFDDLRASVIEEFERGNVAEVVGRINRRLGADTFSLWHLFKDEQRRVMQIIVDDMLRDVEQQYRLTYQRHHALMQASAELNVPLPAVLSTTVSFVLNTDLRNVLQEKVLDTARLSEVLAEVRRWSVAIDRSMISLQMGERCNGFMADLEGQTDNIRVMKSLIDLLQAGGDLDLELDVWKAQNRYFRVGRALVGEKRNRAGAGDSGAARWLEHFDELGRLLRVKTL